jgi:hypothetical protein
MAQKVVVELVDDLDGTVSEDTSTISFSLDGVDYEIDLIEENATRLRDELAGYVAAARRTGGRIKRGTPGPKSAGSTRPTADREKTRTIREWARENGWDLAERGRIPANVIAAYEEAQAARTEEQEEGRGICGRVSGAPVTCFEPPLVVDSGGSVSPPKGRGDVQVPHTSRIWPMSLP